MRFCQWKLSLHFLIYTTLLFGFSVNTITFVKTPVNHRANDQSHSYLWKI